MLSTLRLARALSQAFIAESSDLSTLNSRNYLILNTEHGAFCRVLLATPTFLILIRRSDSDNGLFEVTRQDLIVQKI